MRGRHQREGRNKCLPALPLASAQDLQLLLLPLQFWRQSYRRQKNRSGYEVLNLSRHSIPKVFQEKNMLGSSHPSHASTTRRPPTQLCFAKSAVVISDYFGSGTLLLRCLRLQDCTVFTAVSVATGMVSEVCTTIWDMCIDMFFRQQSGGSVSKTIFMRQSNHMHVQPFSRCCS